MILKYVCSYKGIFCQYKNLLKYHQKFPLSCHFFHKPWQKTVSYHHLSYNSRQDREFCQSKCSKRSCSINYKGFKTVQVIGSPFFPRQAICCFSSQNLPNKTDSNSEKDKDDLEPEPEKKLTLVQRYKKMLKEYWYVLIPVHIATSLVWFGSFYYAAVIGIDIVPFLEALGVSETIIHPLRNSSLGHIAVASGMYKLATPLRYMVTLGGTTITIKQLTKRGLLKPVPTTQQFKTLVKNKFSSNKKS